MNTMELTREIEAAKILREQIADIAQGDEEFIRDTIEGETNVRELIAALVAHEAEDLAVLEGISDLIKKLRDRCARLEGRINTRRALIASGMEISAIDKLETPAGTVSVKNVPPSVRVIEEADIPPRFWKPQAPKLDKKELLAALKAKEIIPGAELSNGSRTIQIRS